MKFIVIILFLLPGFVYAQQDTESSFTVEGIQRNYIVHIPQKTLTGKPAPLVLVFHGGGGNARQVQRYYSLDNIADTAGCYTVYPEAKGKQWNDGREFTGAAAQDNDLLFIDRLLDTLIKKYPIDPKKIFATGISNGGFFTIYLSWKLNSRLAAIAPVCASIPEDIFKDFFPVKPISILLINGTADPIVPYNGGVVGNKMLGNRGNCTSTDQTVTRYLKVNKIETQPRIKNIKNNNLYDRCTATEYIYYADATKSAVTLIKIQNGGHTLPGGNYYLSKRVVGNTCQDFKANLRIWEFFSTN